MEYGNLVKNSLIVFINNIIEYSLASLTVIIGSFFVITAPPLLYGLAHMIVKGAKNENVDFDDVFEGFRSGNFKRSWEYGLLAIAVMIPVFIVWAIFSIFFNLFLISSSAFMSDFLIYFFALILSFIIVIPALFLQLVLYLFVIKRYEINKALSEGINLLKENLAAGVAVFAIIVVLGLVEALPLKIGGFMQWPLIFNLSVFAIAHILIVPLGHLVVANATLGLISEESIPLNSGSSDALQI